jgi:hypothetical protein
MKTSFERKNTDCMQCCLLHCQKLNPRSMFGYCNSLCLSECAVAAAFPPEIVQLSIMPGPFGDCARFVWELAPQTPLMDTVVAVEIAFRSSSSSVPVHLASGVGQSEAVSCGHFAGSKVFDCRGRVVGRLYTTPWTALNSQYYFSIVTPSSPVQNFSLTLNKVSALKKVQAVVSWAPPLNHGGAAVASYNVGFYKNGLVANASILNVTQTMCSQCTVMWLFDESEVDSGCSVSICTSNAHGMQSTSTLQFSDAVFIEEPVAPIIALTPGSVHAASLPDVAVHAGLWSPAQGFSVFDSMHPCASLGISHETEGRPENIQDVRIRQVFQQDDAWCAHELSVRASRLGDCSNVTVSPYLYDAFVRRSFVNVCE